VKLSVNDLLIKALAQAYFAQVPEQCQFADDQLLKYQAPTFLSPCRFRPAHADHVGLTQRASRQPTR
jgi:hypothetical protein